MSLIAGELIACIVYTTVVLCQDTTTLPPSVTGQSKSNGQSILETGTQQLKQFVDKNPLTDDKVQELETKFSQSKIDECKAIIASDKMTKKKVVKKEDEDDGDDDTDGAEGLLGAVEQITNLGGFGKILRNTPVAFACFIRTPLNIIVGLLEEEIRQLKFIQGQKKKKKKRKKPKRASTSKSRSIIAGADKCDCDGFDGPDQTLPAHIARTLQTTVTSLRHVLKLVNILLVTPGGGLCKNNNDDFGVGIGESVGEYVPLTVLGRR